MLELSDFFVVLLTGKETAEISDCYLLKVPSKIMAQPVVPRHHRWIMLLIQIFSSVAMIASFLRIVNQQRLSLYFLVVPFSLFVAILLNRILFLSVHVSNAVIGLISGTVGGILSEVVVDDLMALTLLRKSETICKFCFLELLHFVVLVSLIMYCFYLSCICMYSLHKIFLFIIFVFSLFIMYVIIRLVVPEPLTESIMLVIIMAYFIILNILTVPLKLQLWFLWLVICLVSCFWQIYFLDCLHWEWNRHFLPVPGSAVGMSASFLLSFIMPGYYTTCTQRDRSLLFATIVHSAAFVAVRILVTALRMLSSSVIALPRGNDFWLCTFGLLGCLSLFSKLIVRKLPVFKCFIFIVLIIITYICIGVVNGLITNGYFIDEVIAVSLVMMMLVDDDYAEYSVTDCSDGSNVHCTRCCSLYVGY